jgi:tRNA pseudouridine38-40 synthase
VTRYALGVEYDGSDFLGWQRLGKPGENDPGSVQAVLEDALSYVAAAPIHTVCAGRTDAGVHAACQVVHFDSDAPREPRGWMLGATSRLPDAVCVRWCVPVAGDFHARFSARARRYRYRLLNRPVRPALQRHFLAWERHPLDAEAMARAGRVLLGEHDFSAFRTVHCQAPHARRELQALEVRREGEELIFELQANAFLHHMVRNIVGTLLEVGRGDRPEAWVGDVLHSGQRALAGPTAVPQGLLFLGPRYPKQWALPAEVSL